MEICIVGPGAIGSLFAGFLGKSGEEVYLLDKNPERAEKISKQGIKIEGVSGEHLIKINTTANPEDIGTCELIIVAVKSYHTKEAIERALSLISENTLVLSMQNGLGNLEEIAKITGEEKVIGGITSQGATLLGNGHIRHAGVGETLIGSFKFQAPGSKLQRLEEIANVFNKAGFETKIVDNIQDLIWSKLIINVGINALASIVRVKNGFIVKNSYLYELMKSAVQEAVEIAKLKGINLNYDNPIEKVTHVAESTSENICSMLQDILRKKKTEIDYINGAIVKEAENLNISCPVNKLLSLLVKSIESTYTNQVG